MSNARNARQGFSSKTQCGQRKQIVHTRNLARRMCRKSQGRVLMTHARAFVHDANFVQTTRLQLYRDGSSAAVQTVLHQFLHRRSGALYHFTGRNLADEFWTE